MFGRMPARDAAQIDPVAAPTPAAARIRGIPLFASGRLRGTIRPGRRRSMRRHEGWNHMHAQQAGRAADREGAARRRGWTMVLLAGALALAGCGGGGGGGGGGHPDKPPGAHAVGGTVTGLVGSGLVLTDNGGDALAIAQDGSFTFATSVAEGGTYRVDVSGQPSAPAETCVVQAGTGQGAVAGSDVASVRIACSVNMHKLGGTLSGLRGAGLVLQEAAGDSLPLAADGTFQFPTSRPSGFDYAVTVATQPTNPSQTCTVGGTTGHGRIVDSDIADIAVVCSTNAYTVRALVTGLAGGGLVLQQNGGDDMPVAANGVVTFPTPVASGANYNVTVKHQPGSPSQVCTVSSGSGVVTLGDVADVAILCSTESFALGGNVSGLLGSGLVLQYNGGDDLAVPAAGAFHFLTGVVSGGHYAVAVRAQPTHPAQTCSVSSGATGTMDAADVSDVAVVCSTNSYRVTGTVQGLAGSGLVLQDNGGDDLAVAADGSFQFATPVASGSGYAVTLRSTPATPRQACTVSHASGTMQAQDVLDVQVSCNGLPARWLFMTHTFISLSLGPFYDAIVPYPLDPATGALGTPGPTGSTGRGGRAIAVAPSGRYAYGPNQLVAATGLPFSPPGSVQAYVLDPATGALTWNGQEVPAGLDTRSVAVHPSGKWVYAGNYGDGSISVFAASPTDGQLTPVQTLYTGGGVADIAMHPGGNFLLVARDNAGGIGVFAIDGSTGQLTQTATSTGGGAAWRLALDASGRHVFELDASGGNVGTGAVRSYLFDATTGSLTYGGVAGTGVNPGSIAVHPSGRFVYVGNYGMPTSGTGWIPNGSISVIGVDARSGNFTSNAEMTSGRASACMAADPAGRFLYFQNRGTDTTFTPVITQYAIDPATGALTAVQPDRAEGGCPTLW